MTKDQLYTELNYVDHSRANRLKYSNLVIANPNLIPKLLEIIFLVDDKISCRAAWIFEFLCDKKIEAIIPHLDYFTEHIYKVHLDAAVRPVAKICEYLAKAYYSKNKNKLQKALTKKHQEKIVETCFDWLINDHKIAPKAYSTHTLYLFSTDFDWIHPELVSILERDFFTQSAGYKARARTILKKLQKT